MRLTTQERARAVFRYLVEGQTAEEIAADCGVTQTTVRNWVHQAQSGVCRVYSDGQTYAGDLKQGALVTLREEFNALRQRAGMGSVEFPEPITIRKPLSVRLRSPQANHPPSLNLLGLSATPSKRAPTKRSASRKRLSLSDQAEVVYHVLVNGKTCKEVAGCYGCAKSTVSHLANSIRTGICDPRGGQRPPAVRNLGQAYNNLRVAKGLPPEHLPEPRVLSTDTSAGNPAPDSISREGLREILSLRRVDKNHEENEALVAVIETAWAKMLPIIANLLPIIANLCSELGIEVPTDEEATAWRQR